MAALVIAGVGVGVKALSDLNTTLMARKGSESCRSTGVIFRNFTDQTLYLTSKYNTHGIWTDSAPVPGSIAPNTTAGWMSESQGFMTGTEAGCGFVVGDPNGAQDVLVQWCNPFAGENSACVSTCNGNFKIWCENGEGDNATLIVNFERA